MAQNIPITSVFAAYQDFLDEDQDIKEEIRTVVKEMEQKAREILPILQGVHHSDGIKKIPEICAKARGLLEGVKLCYATLDQKIQRDQYYRFNDFWRFVTQRLSFICAFIVYMETEELITRENTAAMLGVKINRMEGFHMDLEDFLMGLLLLANELSRLAVNAVTSGDYTRPLRITKFLCELDAGFRLLNLKNDSLRKRYDGLKYDVKKVEEVVYDVTIRNLIPKAEAPST